MLSRLVFPIFGYAYWQKAYENEAMNDKINHDFIAYSKVYV